MSSAETPHSQEEINKPSIMERIRGSSQTVLGGSDIGLTPEEEQQALDWALDDKGVPVVAIQDGYTEEARPVSEKTSISILLRKKIMSRSIFRQRQTAEHHHEVTRRSIKHGLIAAGIVGVAVAFCGPQLRLISYVGEANSGAIDLARKPINEENGEATVYNSLVLGPDNLLSETGNALLNRIDYYNKNPNDSGAAQTNSEKAGLKNATEKLISQDFSQAEALVKDGGKVDKFGLEKFKEFAKGKEKNLSTVISYLKSIDNKKSPEYWQNLESKLKEVLK